MTKPNPNSRPYPKNRAPRVDRSKMTEEEWDQHKKKKQCERSARYNDRYPGLTSGRLRQRRAEYPWYQCLLGSGDRARNNNLEYDLTKEWAEKTYTGLCSLTGIPFEVVCKGPAGKSGGHWNSPSIDRINPLKGYTQDNCRFILFAVNSFKGRMSDAQMYHIAEALLANRYFA